MQDFNKGPYALVKDFVSESHLLPAVVPTLAVTFALTMHADRPVGNAAKTA